MSEASDGVEDHNRDQLTLAARSCLDHVRKVKWGTGTVDYEVDDGVARIAVHISVSAVRKLG